MPVNKDFLKCLLIDWPLVVSQSEAMFENYGQSTWISRWKLLSNAHSWPCFSRGFLEWYLFRSAVYDVLWTWLQDRPIWVQYLRVPRRPACTVPHVQMCTLSLWLCRRWARLSDVWMPRKPLLGKWALWLQVPVLLTLRWRHNERDSVSNHQPHDCLLNRLFRRRWKKTSKLRVTGLCAGNSPGTGEFPAQMASYAENVSIWWRHHGENHMLKSTLVYKNVLTCLLIDWWLYLQSVKAGFENFW